MTVPPIAQKIPPIQPGIRQSHGVRAEEALGDYVGSRTAPGTMMHQEKQPRASAP